MIDSCRSSLSLFIFIGSLRLGQPRPPKCHRIVFVSTSRELDENAILGGNHTLMGKLKTTGRITPLDRELVLSEVKDPAKWIGGKIPYFDAPTSRYRFPSRRRSSLT